MRCPLVMTSPNLQIVYYRLGTNGGADSQNMRTVLHSRQQHGAVAPLYDFACYGFCVGRSKTSLMKDCGSWATSMTTAWATSSGLSIFRVSLPPRRGLKSVSTEPGQMTLTRIFCPRSSSATPSLSPFSPHLEAE